jgi:transposase
MRGDDLQQDEMFSYRSLGERIPSDHPLRPMRKMVDEILLEMTAKFKRLYSKVGRPSIAPEKLLRALLLKVLYSIRSERMLMEELDYNLLVRWFVGLSMDDEVWDATTFTKNWERLSKGKIADVFFERVLERARQHRLLSDEHFTVDGTLIEAAAGLKSFKRKEGGNDRTPPDDPGNPTVNFHGEKRSNQTHESTTDPEALLSKKGKGKEAKLNYAGHLLMENRNGLAIDAEATRATGTAERDAGVVFAGKIGGKRRSTMGADKAYDTRGFVDELRAVNVTPHVAQNNTCRRSAIDGRTTRHAGYGISQQKRKRIEEIFGWLKTVAQLRKLQHRGLAKVRWIFKFTVAAYNLVRIRNLVTV